VHVIPLEQLDSVESRDDYVALKSAGRTYRKAQTLASLAATLDPSRFVRVHRSFVLNLDRIRSIELYARNSHVAVLSDGSKVPVSRSGYARLRALLDAGS
jgi:two-component system LytT family response regulator